MLPQRAVKPKQFTRATNRSRPESVGRTSMARGNLGSTRSFGLRNPPRTWELQTRKFGPGRAKRYVGSLLWVVDFKGTPPRSKKKAHYRYLGPHLEYTLDCPQIPFFLSFWGGHFFNTFRGFSGHPHVQQEEQHLKT